MQEQCTQYKLQNFNLNHFFFHLDKYKHVGGLYSSIYLLPHSIATFMNLTILSSFQLNSTCTSIHLPMLLYVYGKMLKLIARDIHIIFIIFFLYIFRWICGRATSHHITSPGEAVPTFLPYALDFIFGFANSPFYTNYITFLMPPHSVASVMFIASLRLGFHLSKFIITVFICIRVCVCFIPNVLLIH